MTKIEQLTTVVERLSDEQVDELLAWARSMANASYYDEASPEARASIARGLDQLAKGQVISSDEFAARIDAIIDTARK